MTGALFMLRATELGLSDADLATMSMGMVFDMAIEKANDSEEWPLKGTASDFMAMIGG